MTGIIIGMLPITKKKFHEITVNHTVTEGEGALGGQ